VISDRDGVRLKSDTLYALIRVVASSPNLDRVLDGVVDILTEATRCHACFVYLIDRERLHLRAASPVYRHLVGDVAFGLDEGLAGWVARNRSPAFIRENALADPRMKYIPEIDEERFESMVAVPVPARSGEAIGVVVLHNEAPREFDDDALSFLGHTASLVAGAIENAQLFESAGRRVQTLTRLSALSQEIAGVATREQLYLAVTAGVRELLGCRTCRLYLLDAATGRLELAATDPAGEPSPWPDEGAGVLLDLLRRREGSSPLLAAPVAAGDENLGVLAVAAAEGRSLGEEDDELLRGIGHQLAVALKKAELIERLTAENVVRDLFEALEADISDVAEARARVAGCDLSRRHVLVHVEAAGSHDDPRPWPAVAERAETRLRRLAPGAVCDTGRDSVRAVLPLCQGSVEEAVVELSAALRDLGGAENLLIGVSGPRDGVQDGSRSLGEARDAARIARALVRGGGGSLAYSELGAYRYLVRLPSGEVPDDRHDAAVARLVEYDRSRRSKLVATLEQYLRDRRSSVTARALYIHPNTLRQRLDRIEKLSGLDLAREDLMSLELAVKLANLRSTGRPA